MTFKKFADTAPYQVNRTQWGSLPVYTEYKCGRGQVLTLIRRVEGQAEVRSLHLRGISIFILTSVTNLEIMRTVAHVLAARTR